MSSVPANAYSAPTATTTGRATANTIRVKLLMLIIDASSCLFRRGKRTHLNEQKARATVPRSSSATSSVKLHPSIVHFLVLMPVISCRCPDVRHGSSIRLSRKVLPWELHDADQQVNSRVDVPPPKSHWKIVSHHSRNLRKQHLTAALTSWIPFAVLFGCTAVSTQSCCEQLARPTHLHSTTQSTGMRPVSSRRNDLLCTRADSVSAHTN